MRKIKIFSSAALLCLSISCHKSDPQPDCGCNSKTFTQITRASAAYAGHYDFYIKVENVSGSTTALVSLCQPVDTSILVNDSGAYKYQLSGKLRGVCIPADIHPIFPLFELSLDSLTLGNTIIKTMY